MSGQDDSQPFQSQDSMMTITDDDRHEILYFAYGSNLSTEQMRQRCPYSTPIGLGFLPGWKWIINERGYANVISPSTSSSTPTTSSQSRQDEGAGVYGLLYLLPPRDEELLDGYEGVPWAYGKLHCDARWVSDADCKPPPLGSGTVKVLVYVDETRTTEDKPKDEYVGRMERGIEDAVQNWGLNENYANTVMRRFWKK